MISVPRPLLSAFLLALLCSVPLRAELSLLSGVSIPGGGEVVAHYNPASGGDRVLVTNSLARTAGVSHRVDIYSLAASGGPAWPWLRRREHHSEGQHHRAREGGVL